MTAVAVAGLVAAIAARRGTDAAVAAVVGWAVVRQPLPAAAVLLVVIAARRWRAATRITSERAAADGDVVMLAELVGLGLTAGRTVRAAFEHAAGHIHPMLGAEVDRLVAAMDREGTAVALAGASGRLGELGRVVSGAVVSGAPVAAAVAAHAERLRHTRHAIAVAAARRLPVRLLLPLALLILPGFVVLAVGPAVIQSLARLGPIP